MIRVLIVDDEPLARQGIRLRLEREPDMAIVGEADDGPSAVEEIRSLRPDLLFLDIQIPGLSGFEVLEQVSDACLPMVVFVTAHDAHALKAFDVHALDYLLKPFTEARFRETLSRARAELLSSEDFPVRRRMTALLDSLHQPQLRVSDGGVGWLRRFTVRDRNRILLVRTGEVEAIEAAGNYVELVCLGARHLIRQTLVELEARLDPVIFARIHRGTIINLEQVLEIRPEPHGNATVIMKSGAAYRLSRAYRKRLLPRA